MQNFTRGPISVAAIEPKESEGIQRPEWIRLPRKGTFCPYCGLSRTSLNELILPSVENGYRPPVHSISLRKRGKLRGARLIAYDSLMNYLRAQLANQRSIADGEAQTL
jgi:hypothetical protein